MIFKKNLKIEDVAGNISESTLDPLDPETELLKSWVEELRRIKNRDYIFRKLLSAITYILSKGTPIQVNDKSTEIVEGDFLNFLRINDYHDRQVLWATEQVLSWYTKENPDLVMQAHVSNIVNNSLLELKHIKRAQPKTFKDQLIEKVEHSLTLDDIQNHIESIKRIMNDHYDARKFTLDLFAAQPGAGIALGNDRGSSYSTFIPEGCSPKHYVELFAKAFNKLGFKAYDMAFDYQEFTYHRIYSITLKW